MEMDFEFSVSLRCNRGALLLYLHSSPSKITKTANHKLAQCFQNSSVLLLYLLILLPVCCIQKVFLLMNCKEPVGSSQDVCFVAFAVELQCF